MRQSHVGNLDALRAIAVILVMTYHARMLACGWIGVWLFFCISGFLITRTLLELKGLPVSAGLQIFYVRRSLRIFPAYYLFLLVVLCVSIAVGKFTEIMPALVSASVYLLNVFQINHEVSGRLIVHLWSLCVEEQYYLLIAPVVLLSSRKSLVSIFAAGIVAVPILRLAFFLAFAAQHDTAWIGKQIYGLAIFQADSFMFGGLLALFESQWRAARRRPAAILIGLGLSVPLLCVVLNAAALAFENRYALHTGIVTDFAPVSEWRLSPTSFGLGVDPMENGAQVWLYTALAVFGTTLIAALVRFPARASFTVLNAIGRVSYGMYLVHMPLVSAFDVVIRATGAEKHSLAGIALFAVFLALVWGLAWLSFEYVERRFLRLKDRFAPMSAQRPGGSAEPRYARSSASRP